MSISALLKAVRDQLRKELRLFPEECRILPGPNPPPSVGDRFIAVYASDWTVFDRDLDQGLDESYGVKLALTYRTTHIQFDDQGEEAFLHAYSGMELLVRSAIKAIHKQIPVMEAANAFISDDVYQIIEPLRFQQCDASPVVVDSGWFQADSRASTGDDACGLAQIITFGDARRTQRLGSDFR